MLGIISNYEINIKFTKTSHFSYISLITTFK